MRRVSLGGNPEFVCGDATNQNVAFHVPEKEQIAIERYTTHFRFGEGGDLNINSKRWRRTTSSLSCVAS